MTEYNVRLTLPVTADTPEEAVNGFIELINRTGLRTWVYRVAPKENPGKESYLDGDGATYDLMGADGKPQDDEDELVAIATDLIDRDLT